MVECSSRGSPGPSLADSLRTGLWRAWFAAGGRSGGDRAFDYNAAAVMEEWLFQFADQGALLAYLSIFGVLLISGFGLPLPEDIPLIVGGYLAGIGVVNPWIMIPGTFIAIVGSDGIVYFLGRRYGHHVPRLPVLRRFLTEARLAKTEAALHKHGGKFIFMARFLPGVRTPAFFTAGGFKMPYWKFLLFDGSAACRRSCCWRTHSRTGSTRCASGSRRGRWWRWWRWWYWSRGSWA